MAKVVEFPGVTPKRGDFAFMQCPCDPEAWLMPVALVDQQAPIITGLQCPKCHAYHDVINGVVQLSASEG